jgi:hypothetical protein
MKYVRLPLIDTATLRRKVKNSPYIDTADYIEAIEYSAMPQDFDPDFISRHKKFSFRKSLTKFKWVTQKSPNNINHLCKLEDNDRTVTKLMSNGWDMAVLSNTEFKSGTHYYEIEIINVNNDKSGLVLGVTNNRNIPVDSFSSCYGLGMTGSPYNVAGGGYNTFSFNSGDVFGTLIDFNKDDIKFYRNGSCIGKSNTKPSIFKAIYACAFMYYQNDKITLLANPKHQIYNLINNGY